MNTKDYLQHVYMLERSCYEQEQFISRLKRKAESIRYPVYEKTNALHKTSTVEKYDITEIIMESIFWGGILGIASLILVFILDRFVFDLIDLFDFRFYDALNNWFYHHGWDTDFISWGQALILLILASPGIIVAVYNVVKDHISKRKSTIAHNKEIESQNRRITEKNKQIAAKNEKLRNQASLKLKIINSQIARMERCNSETRKTLDHFYSANIIYPKYWNMVAVSTFLEYLCSGRCTTLEGHDGAYNLYEQERRMDVIIGRLGDIIIRLDKIIEQLDRIESNQYMLVSEIQENSRRLDRAYTEISNCADNLKSVENAVNLAAYYNSIEAINTTYMAWYKEYR